MSNLKVKFKKNHPNAVTPAYSKPGDNGLDLTAVDIKVVREDKTPNVSYIEYDTGISLELPEGYVGLIFPRSSVSDRPLMLANGVGVCDSGYRGVIKLRFKAVGNGSAYQVGDRVGQLIILPVPTVELEEVIDLAASERGEGGFGSTGA